MTTPTNVFDKTSLNRVNLEDSQALSDCDCFLPSVQLGCSWIM